MVTAGPPAVDLNAAAPCLQPAAGHTDLVETSVVLHSARLKASVVRVFLVRRLDTLPAQFTVQRMCARGNADLE